MKKKKGKMREKEGRDYRPIYPKSQSGEGERDASGDLVGGREKAITSGKP